jgi:hypothetical protein
MVCQWLVAGRWFSLGTPVFSTNKTDRHDIIKILLKVPLNTISITLFKCILFWVQNGWWYSVLPNIIGIPSFEMMGDNVCNSFMDAIICSLHLSTRSTSYDSTGLMATHWLCEKIEDTKEVIGEGQITQWSKEKE